jgi:hypothetical protein
MARRTSVSSAAMRLGLLTSPARAAHRSEMQLCLREAINRVNPIDREMLSARHFWELGDADMALVP